MKDRSQRFHVLVIAASFFLLAIALIFQTWLAQRYAIWGDEWDTIAPAFLKWRGSGKTFWWQIGQYNANPPGDNFVLRVYYLLGGLNWLKDLNEELFWRLPYLLVWSFTCLAAFWGAFKLTGSWLFAFFSFCFTLAAPGPLTYATEVRFYIWLVFFMTLAVWQTLATIEARFSVREFTLLSLIAAVGVCFHLMLAAVGYLVFFTGIGLTALSFVDLKKKKPKRFQTKQLWNISYLLIGAIPFTVYKVELKHWLFIPPPHSGASAWQRFQSTPWRDFLDAFASNLPMRADWIIYGTYLLTTALILTTAYFLAKKTWKNGLQGLTLLFFLWACPVALFISAAHREYGLITRHFIFEVPVVAAALVFLFRSWGSFLEGQHLRLQQIAAATVFAVLFGSTLQAVTSKTSDQKTHSPAKVNYSLPAWRSYFSNLPDPRPLVIVGTRPDRFHYGSDLGTYMAGMFSNYGRPYTPAYYSTHGAYSKHEKPDAQLKMAIEKSPEDYDFLMVDSLDGLKRLFPNLQWNRLGCKTFETNNLHACRVRRANQISGVSKSLNTARAPGTSQSNRTTAGLVR